MTEEHRAVVVVGVDGSPDSQKAVAWANHYVGEVGGRLRLVTAWAWPRSYGQELHVDSYHPEVEAKATVEKAMAELSIAGDHIEISIQEGAASTVLINASRDASLLVVGSRSYNALTRALLGSVSSYCVHDATCPVVVVK